jgi:hypothetical protein
MLGDFGYHRAWGERRRDVRLFLMGTPSAPTFNTGTGGPLPRRHAFVPYPNNDPILRKHNAVKRFSPIFPSIDACYRFPIARQ